MGYRCKKCGLACCMFIRLYYACLLDCSKAFDHVRHDMLLQKLMSTGLPPMIIRSLMYMYSNSKIQV